MHALVRDLFYTMRCGCMFLGAGEVFCLVLISHPTISILCTFIARCRGSYSAIFFLGHFHSLVVGLPVLPTIALHYTLLHLFIVSILLFYVHPLLSLTPWSCCFTHTFGAGGD